MDKFRTIVFVSFLYCSLPLFCSAQAPAKTAATDVVSSAKHAVSLAQSGHCNEALPIFKHLKLQPLPSDLKRSVGFAAVRCAMFADQPEIAANFLSSLNQEFPHDPEVLYLSVHTYSDLSSRAAADLARTASTSAPGRELHAEALESEQKWDEAAKEYRLILKENPQSVGIHFRLGRLLLSGSNPAPSAVEEAKQEFEKELQIDPTNAGAEYVLGEMAKQNQQWDDAIQHFSRAAKLDAGFGDAYVGWGGSLVSEKKFSDAISPLETAVRLESGNPAAHYLLAVAYSRTGRKEDGDKEFSIQKALTQKGAAGEPAPDSQSNPN
jgi:tetratricopeptide (TPR) repeat protein